MAKLPASWRLRVDPGTRRLDAGRVWLGGSPFRVWRLDDRAAALADRLLGGGPIGDDASAQSLVRRLLDAGMAHPVAGLTKRSPGDVIVVVPFFGPADELAATLSALGPTGPVIVVDDASPDPTVADVARRFGARVERHSTNRGPGAARNTGWRLADTELVAFVDGGCIPVGGWLETLLPHFDDPQVAAVAPRIATIASPSLPATLAAYEAVRPSLDRGDAAAVVRPRSRVPFVPSATLVIRRADLAAIGGFDETFRQGEDVDLVWRLNDADHTVRYEPASVVGHRSRTTASAWLRQRFDYGTSAAPLARRHGDAVRPFTVSAPIAAAVALAAGGAPVPALMVAAATTVRLGRQLPPVPRRSREAIRLSMKGHGYGALALTDAIRRPWWPLALAATLWSRRARQITAAALVVPPLIEWAKERPPLDPVRWIAFRAVDDAAYGAGVWTGSLRERSVAALTPAISWYLRRSVQASPEA